MLTRLFARRYLFSRNARSVVNIIAGVSIFAVAVPVAAMVVLLSVFNGFESLVRLTASAFDADITVEAARGGSFEIERLRGTGTERAEGVAALSYAVEQGALLVHGGRQTTATVRGVDEAYADVMPVGETIVAGRYEVQLGEDVNRLIPGSGVAAALGVHAFAFDNVEVYALKRGSFSTLLPMSGINRASLPVAGIFALDADTDSGNALTSLRAAQRLFDLEGRATSLMIRVADGRDRDRVAREVQRKVGGDFRVQTREERNATFYNLMRYEKWGIFFISLMVLVIASFSIAGTLAMLMVEKRDDMATLRALGADTALLRRIFTAEGLLVCGIGGLGGLAAGIALALVQQHFGIIAMPAGTFLVDRYPVELHGEDIAAVAAAFTAVAWAVSSVTVRSMLRGERVRD